MGSGAAVTILVVEDDPTVAEVVRTYLQRADLDVELATDGVSALAVAARTRPDLVVLDLMLPGLSGLEVCSRLRQSRPDLPVVMLTALGEESDRILGLETGADDYLVKPFSPRELVLRVKNLLQRRGGKEEKHEQIQLGDLVLDIPRHLVTFKGKALELTATEFRLMTILAQRKGRVQSREQLLKDVWGYESDIDTRTVDTHMRRLRDKLGDAADYLDTVRGVGYRILDQ